jgi:hypothetical protein
MFLTSVVRVALLAHCLALAAPAVAAPAGPVPPFVAQLAEAAIAREPSAMHAPDRDKAVAWFSAGFIEGFLAPPDMSWPSAAGPGFEGMRAGQAYRRAHPARHDDVLRAYGYVPSDVAGRCAVGVEASRFTPRLPDDASPIRKIDANWWVAQWPPSAAAPPASRPASGRGRAWPCRIVGWLSPPGHYGHMNMYSHQMVAIRVEDLPEATTLP